jgi:hypothetical protein
VAAETVVENCPRVFGKGEHDPFTASCDRNRLRRLDENHRLFLVPAVADQPQPPDGKRCGPCRWRDVICLVEQSARSVEIALQAAHVRERSACLRAGTLAA